MPQAAIEETGNLLPEKVAETEMQKSSAGATVKIMQPQEENIEKQKKKIAKDLLINKIARYGLKGATTACFAYLLYRAYASMTTPKAAQQTRVTQDDIEKLPFNAESWEKIKKLIVENKQGLSQVHGVFPLQHLVGIGLSILVVFLVSIFLPCLPWERSIIKLKII